MFSFNANVRLFGQGVARSSHKISLVVREDAMVILLEKKLDVT